MLEGEAHVLVVELFHRADQAGQAHRLGIGEAARSQLVPRVLRVELALEAPEHVVGVERAGGLEVVGAVELHALAQGEGVLQAVVTDRPAFRQRRHHAGAAGGELYQALEHRLGRGVGGGGGGVLGDVEPFRAGLGADHQRLAERRRAAKQADEGQADERVAHGGCRNKGPPGSPAAAGLTCRR
ncbi:hypothetical protein D9M69_524600 [compost metagenome]